LPRNLKTLFFALIILCAAPYSAWAREWRFDDVGRVVAIADIHGAYDAMVATLQNVDVLGDDLAWVGEQTHLVIVGDILDRSCTCVNWQSRIHDTDGRYALRQCSGVQGVCG